jgi:hypothetical protein
MGRFLRLMNLMGSLATIQTLTAGCAEVILREEFPLAGGTFSPELSSVLAVQGLVKTRGR